MRGLVATRLLLDTSYWIALLDPPSSGGLAEEIHERVERAYTLVPWPTLYEFVNTRLVRRDAAVARFRRILKMPGVLLVDDRAYRDDALEWWLGANGRRRPMSLVDVVLRGVAEDSAHRISGLVTTNPNDFRDICARRRIELIPEAS